LNRQRWVIHADLDAFFAAAEVLRHPELAGKPVIIGHAASGRGVVSSATYEARAFGVRSAMPVGQALRLCPDAVLVSPDFDYYRELSRRFKEILDVYSPLVEMVSVDEAYLDASDSDRLFGGAVQLAGRLKQHVRDDLGLVVSLGVASNKLVAKIASDLDKPDGLRVVEPGTEAATFAPLAIDRLPGIGPKTGARLRAAGITTLGELAATSEAALQRIAGNDAAQLLRRARGEDARDVRSARDPRKSVGHERTFSSDRHGIDRLTATLYDLAERTGAELRSKGQTATTINLKLRYGDFTTVSRQATAPLPTDAHQEIYTIALRLLERALTERNAPVRLIGVRVTGLSNSSRQLNLFDTVDIRAGRTQRLNAALDTLNQRSGERLLIPARFIASDRPRRRTGGE
jgi:DNA polymerase-4